MKVVFVDGDLKETIYMEKLWGFVVLKSDSKSCFQKSQIWWSNRKTWWPKLLSILRHFVSAIFSGRFCISVKNRIAFLGLDCSNILRDSFTININLLSDEYVCRKQGLKANIQTRVYRGFLLVTNTRVGIVLIHLEQNTVRIESLGHGKRLRLQ